MRYSRRGFVAAAVLSVGGLAGCGGGGSRDDGGTASASGRFTVRDVTPKNLTQPIDGIPVTAVEVVGGSTQGLVAGALTLRTDYPSPSLQDLVPVVIDIRKRTFQRLRDPGTATRPALERGAPQHITADGEVFGFFYPLNFGPSASSYDFTYSPATDTTTSRPSILERRGQVQYEPINDARQAFSVQNDQWSVVNFDAPETNPQPITPPPGYTLQAQYLNNAGEVAGRLFKPSGALIAPAGVFFWKNGVTTVLPPLAERKVVSAQALTDDGRVIGTAVDAEGKNHVVSWQNGEITPLPDPLGDFTTMVVLSANSRGDILALVTRGTVTSTLLFQKGAWIDLLQEVTNSTAPVRPEFLLDDGRLLCTNGNKLYTLTPRS